MPGIMVKEGELMLPSFLVKINPIPKSVLHTVYCLINCVPKCVASKMYSDSISR